MRFADLNPPYRTIVADPPWDHREGTPNNVRGRGPRTLLRYSWMELADIHALPVADIAAQSATLYLWTTNRYLRASYGVAETWGFTPKQMLVWCKPIMGWQPGGCFGNSTEFVLRAQRGTTETLSRENQSHWEWPRSGHSQKPSAFMDIVERVSPGPYVELFARQPRLGWDSWGYGVEGVLAATEGLT